MVLQWGSNGLTQWWVEILLEWDGNGLVQWREYTVATMEHQWANAVVGRNTATMGQQ